MPEISRVPKRRKLNVPGSIDKSSIQPRGATARNWSEGDIADVYRTFPDWNKDDIAAVLNKSPDMPILAKMPLLSQLDIRPKIKLAFKEWKLRGYLIASRGELNKVRCTTCRNNYGPFLGGQCRSAWIRNIKVSGGACGADIWANESAKCNHADNYNKKAHGHKKEHIETQRRIAGFAQNSDIDKDGVEEPARSTYGVIPSGWVKFGMFLIPAGMGKEAKHAALGKAWEDLRIERGGEKLIIRDTLTMKKDEFYRWALENGRVEPANGGNDDGSA